MKSDEEFIRGIYRKAEQRKKEESNAGCGRHFRAWQPLAAAACLCLIVSGAVYAGSRKEVPHQEPDPGKGAVMALSVDDAGIPAADGELPGNEAGRVRMSDGMKEGDSPKAGQPDTYQLGAQWVDENGRQGKDAALNGLWACHELARSIKAQERPAKEGMEKQEAGGSL